MAYDFEKTALYRRTLAVKDDEFEASRTRLRQAYLSMRSKVSHLVDEIGKELPQLTVHDISHLDALWETASIVAGDELPLNPAEGFLLGGAILLHDAAMSLAAFPGGISELRNSPEWKDAVASHLFIQNGIVPTLAEVANPPDEVSRCAIFDVLRALHAKQAAKLPSIEWIGLNGEPEFLIEDVGLRRFYGNCIGRLAESHWWYVRQLEMELPKVITAGPNIPVEWTVDPVKVGCLLRAADASHIDHRRAPHFLAAIVKHTGVSALHWKFQERLGKPSVDGDALVYSSGDRFAAEDADAWWLCFDTIKMIDSELREIDILLETTGRVRLQVRRVRAAGSPSALSRYIQTEKWTPVDTELKVSDVPTLVEMLGGKQLYGNDLSIPLRELIQNASDAIRARRLLKEDPTIGRVRVSLTRDGEDYWLHIQDNGIGMSQNVLTSTLIDFGRSIWRSDIVRKEFPGLIAKGMNATGRFGIGFFSVFMLGKKVVVTTRQIDAAATDTHTLDFYDGLHSRPLLREPLASETLPESGTRVSVLLDIDPKSKRGLLHRTDLFEDYTLPLASLVVRVCPGLDVDIEVIDSSEGNAEIIEKFDWEKIDGGKLAERIWIGKSGSMVTIYKQKLSNMRHLRDSNGKIYGLAAIVAERSFYSSSNSVGVVTVGGFRAVGTSLIAGVLNGTVLTVDRNTAVPTVPVNVLREWASAQANIISRQNDYDSSKMDCASTVLWCGGEIGELPIIWRNDEALNSRQFRKVLREQSEVVILEGGVTYEEDEDDVPGKDFDEKFEAIDDLFILETPSRRIISGSSWPRDLPDWPSNIAADLEDVIDKCVRQVWGSNYQRIDTSMKVGEVDGTDIERDVVILRREDRVVRRKKKK